MPNSLKVCCMLMVVWGLAEVLKALSRTPSRLAKKRIRTTFVEARVVAHLSKSLVVPAAIMCACALIIRHRSEIIGGYMRVVNLAPQSSSHDIAIYAAVMTFFFMCGAGIGQMIFVTRN